MPIQLMTLSSCARKTSERFQEKYVLHIIPKRQEKGHCCLARQHLEWMPGPTTFGRLLESRSRALSFWIKDLHITLGFASENDMWMSVSMDAIATIRFLGIYAYQVVICRRQPLLQAREVLDLKNSTVHPRSSAGRSLRILVNLLTHSTHLSEPRFAENSTNADIRHPPSTPSSPASVT